MRHTIKRGFFSPLIAAFGGTRDKSYVEVGESAVTFKFGRFEERIPLDMVDGAKPTRWPTWGGIGWRILPGRVLGLVGALDGTVEVALNTTVKSRIMVFPVTFEKVVVSLEDPDGFLQDLRDARA